MNLVRLSGHSGAGKSRLVAGVRGLCPRAVLYTSRPARAGEAHGRDYYFLSRAAIAALPPRDFFVGPARNMLQAVDLVQLEHDLRASDVVLIEIFPALWPGLLQRLRERVGAFHTASVFLTAVDPVALRALPDEDARRRRIRDEVAKNLAWRNKDDAREIEIRAASAAHEVSQALGPAGAEQYTDVLHSSPEGPDGDDDWTSGAEPVGRARAVLERFAAVIAAARRVAAASEHQALRVT